MISPDFNAEDLPPNCGEPRGHRLAIEGLGIRYGNLCALEDVSFEIHCGRSLGLVGPNGAGKSTLLKAIAGLLDFQVGTIAWRSRALAASNREIAYLAQRNEVDWNFPLTVRGLVEMGRYPHLGWWRRFGRMDRDVVDDALEKMRLHDLAGRQICALSGGQQQRAFVARALAQEAHVFLLDEPFTGLDSPSRSLLTELLGNLAASGRLIIASHHELDTVPEIFDDVLLLRRRAIAFGPVDQVYTPANLEACFGSMNFLLHQSPADRESANSGPVMLPS